MNNLYTPKTITALTLLFLCLCRITASAQHKVTGKVVGKDGKEMPLVNVAFLSAKDSTLAAGTVTDSLGRYSAVLAKGRYTVRYSFLSCRTLSREINVSVDAGLPDVTMEPSATMLGEVKVSRKRPTMRLTGSGLLVDVESDSILNRQNDIYELLGRIPGIMQTGRSVTVIGKQSLTFYINGRQVMDASEVDNLQVDQVKSVKVVTGTDVSYNAGTGAVIDIRTKRLGEGLAFNATGNLTQGRYMSPRAGIYSQYNAGKWDFFLYYSYSRPKLLDETFSKIQTKASSVWDKDEYLRSVSSAGNHSYKAGMTYHFSPESSLGVQYIGDYSRTESDGKDSLTVTPEGGKPTFLTSNTAGTTYITSHHANLNYNARIGENWSLSTCADYINRLQDGDRSFAERDYAAGERSVSYSQKSRWNVAAANIHASYSSDKFGNLAFGYDFSHSWGRDRIAYKSSDNNGNTRNRETKNAFFLKYSRPFGDFTVEAGLRYENVYSVQRDMSSSGRESHSVDNFLPSLSLSHMKGVLMQSINADIETTRPDFTDMNDNQSYQNRYYLTMGNSGLKTSTSYNLGYKLMYKFLYFSVGYSYIRRPLTTVVYGLEEDPSVLVSTQENFSDRHALTSTLYLRHKIKWWAPSFSLVYMKMFAEYPGPGGTTLHNGRPAVFGTLSSDFDLPKGFMLSPRFDYNFGGHVQTLRLRPKTSFDLSLKKSFMKDRLRLSIDAYDIFNKNKDRIVWRINNVNLRQRFNHETRKFGITLTWRFRKIKEVEKQSAAEEEMSRLKLKEEE